VSALLREAFSVVCGQNPDHLWMPGGWSLPCCQRCVGLYAGAAFAIVALILLRPRPTSRFLKCHGLFLAQMIPFGFHWVPEGAVLRTVTGSLFGFGVVAFLWLEPHAALDLPFSSERGKPWRYYAGLGLGLMTVVAMALWGGRAGAWLLMAWLAIGALALAGLFGANAALGLAALRGCFRFAPRRLLRQVGLGDSR
jgi:uncharacterized membrane protein